MIAQWVLLSGAGLIVAAAAGLGVYHWNGAPQPDGGLPQGQTKQLEAASKAPGPAVVPGLDIARLDPNGVSVFAGRAKPYEWVTVLADGVSVGRVRADENGEWVLISQTKLASVSPVLDLKFEAPTAVAAKSAASKQDPARDTARSEAAAARAPSVAAVNSQMMSNLQGLVDQARKPASEPTQQPAIREKPGAGAPTLGAGSAYALASGNLASSQPMSLSGPRAEERPAPIPVPIKFVFRKTEFSKDGDKAASLLLEYLKAKKFDAVALSGHADDRGSDTFNFELSEGRLKTVEDYLRAGGFRGRISLLPKGKSMPYAGVDRSKYSRDELYELDRRVEIQSAN
jgi:outer membrane protein OmpA-like peptidoglycan-associated protein